MARLNRIKWKKIAKTIVQDASPYKSGNLQQKAIKATLMPNGIKVFVLDNVAGYGEVLDRRATLGKNVNKHKGWFSKRAYGNLGAYINASMNKRKTQLTSSTERVAKNKDDNLLRQTTYLRNMKRG